MKKRLSLILLGCVMASQVCVASSGTASRSVERPNIIWLVTEDNSVDYLRLYDPDGAPMPTVERLAKKGIVFNNAFSNTPVCSTARSAIISGCYGPSTFTQFHRSAIKVPLPGDLHMFPWYLRQAGYYTSNNAKQDYNFLMGENVWDESSKKASYRRREPGQPFFHVQNFEITHESRLHFSRQQWERQASQSDVEKVPVFPIHPDTPLFRYTNARYRNLHKAADAQLEAFLKELEADGLMDDTIIFYYGDNGGVLPGSKGYIYERGLHVPMVVYVPERWRHLMPFDKAVNGPAQPGIRVDGFVQFIDLAPTVLNLAGISLPKEMDGRPFLGGNVELEELNKRDFAFSYADRFDEKVDLVRAIRKGKYKYIRNYQPFNVDALQNNYRYRMLAYQEWKQLYNEGRLSEEQARFFKPRPVEALYDLETDPFELHNLAPSPEYRETLIGMREMLHDRLCSMPDLSFIPECVLHAEAAENPFVYGQEQKKQIAQLVRIADLALLPWAQAREEIGKALGSENPLHRYWAVIVCTSFSERAAEFVPRIRRMATDDANNLVRMRAAEYLGLTQMEDPRPFLIDCLKHSRSVEEATLILNTVVLLHDSGPDFRFSLDRSWVPSEWLANSKSNVVRRFEYLEGTHP